MISAILIALSVIVFALTWRRAYIEAKQEERRELLKERMNRLQRWDRD
jgi:hypothetical protein